MWVVLVVAFAPAPLDRPARRPVPPAIVVWVAQGVRVELHPGGKYVERWHGVDYKGTWEVRDKGLWVICSSSNGLSTYEFRVQLQRDGALIFGVPLQRGR